MKFWFMYVSKAYKHIIVFAHSGPEKMRWQAKFGPLAFSFLTCSPDCWGTFPDLQEFSITWVCFLFFKCICHYYGSYCCLSCLTGRYHRTCLCVCWNLFPVLSHPRWPPSMFCPCSFCLFVCFFLSSVAFILLRMGNWTEVRIQYNLVDCLHCFMN